MNATAPWDTRVLLECVRTAVLAPSLHNSQPWRFRIRDGVVAVYADRSRRLDALDPDGREMMISVGAAVFTLRLAVRVRGRVPDLGLFPDPDDPDLVAVVTPGRPDQPSAAAESLAAAVTRRHTNRWPFAPEVVPDDIVHRMTEAAGHEGAVLTVAGAVGRTAILQLSRAAESRLRSRGSYRAELAAWTSRSPARHDGVPPAAMGPWDALERLPMRDFGLMRPQIVPAAEPFEAFPTIVVLATDGDDVRQWVAAGQALQRVLLVATRDGLATTPISQPVEIPVIRELLTDTRSGRWAQMVLRVGYGRPAAVTPRRPLDDVLER